MYKLNHLQTTLRNELDEEIQEKKVHPSSDKLVHNNVVSHKKYETDNSKEYKKKKKYYTVDGFNSEKSTFQIEAEKSEIKYSYESMGVFIDKKK